MHTPREAPSSYVVLVRVARDTLAYQGNKGGDLREGVFVGKNANELVMKYIP